MMEFGWLSESLLQKHEVLQTTPSLFVHLSFTETLTASCGDVHRLIRL